MKNPFVFACITPHGSEIIAELSQQNVSLMEKTRHSMEKLGSYMAEQNPDTIIVLTPHGVRIDGQFCVANSETMEGKLEEHGGIVEMKRSVDRELAQAITGAALSKGLPIGQVNFATSAGPYSCLPLDWGVIVPLHFMPDVPIVVITPSRYIDLESHVELGEVLADVVRSSGKKVGLIASCDWAHAHDAEGPYGFDPAAKKFDEEIVEMIKNNDIEAMMNFDLAYVEAAKPDGIWQTVILGGAIPKEERKVEFLSYEVPTYFGLLCAAYHKK